MRFLTSLDYLPQFSELICIDFETTSLTNFSPRCKPFGPKTRIGEWSYAEYLALHTETVIDYRQRARILAAAWFEGAELKSAAWDLDALGAAGRRKLIHHALHGRVVVGHNLPFDLSWASWYSNARPRAAIDTLLWARILMPDRALGFGKPYSLDALSGNTLDKRYQRPENWCVSPLVHQHYDYCLGDVAAPLALVGAWQLLPRLEAHKNDPYTLALLQLPILLARMHHRGLPIDEPYLGLLAEQERALAGQKRIELVQTWPALRQFGSSLTEGGVTDKLRDAVLQALREDGVHVDKLDKKAVAFAGGGTSPGWVLRSAMESAKKTVGTLDSVVDHLDVSGGLHPLFTTNTNTLRMSSACPNSQNFKRTDEFRAIVRARAGWKILSLDYSAIELRIAAQLAQKMKTTATVKYVREAQSMAAMGVLPPRQEVPQRDSGVEAWVSYLRAELAHCFAHSDGQMMRLFQDKLDPHLATALKMVGEPDPFGRLRADDGSLKKLLALERQNAKPLNFGLLYGLSAETLHEYGVTEFGLDWDIGKAIADRAAWFGLYADIRLWQMLTKAECRTHGEEGPDEGDGKHRRWKVRTLTGRVMIVDQFTRALNYQVQGSGADLLYLAANKLTFSEEFLTNLIHDELLFHVPESLLDEVEADARAAMMGAGRLLLPDAGVEVESNVSDTWRH